MGGPPGSQAAPLPSNLPFRLVSKTIGSGAYASIRKAVPLNSPKPVIAVKFINKEHALRTGRLKQKQLEIEASLHKSVTGHQNIIRFLSWGSDSNWVWMCLELAEGGDLFDKIEADEGVGEDVAQVYFTQLVSAIAWTHGKGVAHRDIKPENMLLSGEGELKLADFGLATQFAVPGSNGGKRKRCGMVCGSPPYIAPEILAVGHGNLKRKTGEEKLGYDPQVADLWSCAIVLFVLLAGNTPWDSPVLEESYEYADFVRSNGKPEDELWQKVPMEALSLLRGMLRTTAEERFTFEDVRRHPWFTRRNPHLNKEGKIADQIALATRMMEGMHINLQADITPSQRQRPQSQRQRARPTTDEPMDIDTHTASLDPQWTKFASTQPMTPISDVPFDWEAAPPIGLTTASQPTTSATAHHPPSTALAHSDLLQQLAEDPSMSQFLPTPSVPLTATQAARQFRDIAPSHSLTRFVSLLPFAQLLPLLETALHRLSIPTAKVSTAALEGKEERVVIRIKTVDARQQLLQGSVVVEPLRGLGIQGVAGMEQGVLEVRLLKAKGDPLGWRRLFKQVAVLCKEAVVLPGQL